jgi:predicted nucleic acid-binding protein
MLAELVVDASVVAKFYFHEDGSERAQSILTSGLVLAAPDLLRIEVANLAARKFRLGLATRDRAREAVASLGDLIDEFAADGDLANGAFRLAADSGCSAFDATYLSMAQDRGLRVLTADQRLVQRAQGAGVGHLVQAL